MPPPSLVCSAPTGPAPSRGVLLSPSLQQDPHLRSSLGVQSEQRWGGGKRAGQRSQGGQHLVEGNSLPHTLLPVFLEGQLAHSGVEDKRCSFLQLADLCKGQRESAVPALGGARGEASFGTLRTLTCLPVLLAWWGLPGHGDLGLLCLVTGARERPFGHREHSRDVCLSEGGPSCSWGAAGRVP